MNFDLSWMTWRDFCYKKNGMRETDFVMRESGTEPPPWFKTTPIQLRMVDGVLIVGFLAAFLGLVLLLSK